MSSLTLNVNGRSVTADVPDRTLLVECIREALGLTGTHVGCDTSQCGACVVLVNGRSVKSCSMFAWEADGAEITTIEGVARDGELHPIQQSFIDNGGFQCGICTSGQIVAAKSLLDANPSPTEEQVKAWMMGNLCRCTGYYQILESIMKAARHDA